MANMKLATMDNSQFKTYARTFWIGVDKLMRRSCAGGLQYGWDMSTFGVLFPVERSKWRMICKEASHRGITKA